MKKAFTLVEVLLATAILSVSLVALLTGASRCLSVMKQAKSYQTAQWTLGLGEVDHPLEATNIDSAVATQQQCRERRGTGGTDGVAALSRFRHVPDEPAN